MIGFFKKTMKPPTVKNRVVPTLGAYKPLMTHHHAPMGPYKNIKNMLFVTKISQFVLFPMPCCHLSCMPTLYFPRRQAHLLHFWSATFPHLLPLSFVICSFRGRTFWHVAIFVAKLVGHVSIFCRLPPPPRCPLFVVYRHMVHMEL